MNIYEAVEELDSQFQGQSWYVRTTVLEESYPGRGWTQSIAVWGRGPQPDSVPVGYEGYHVVYERVSKQNPCPFLVAA